MCAAFARPVNSYKRLVRQGAMSYFSWAPVFNSYGSNNPHEFGACACRRRPLRITQRRNGAVNPYLAATLALAAGLEGIREKIDPGTPNEDNLYMISESERRDRKIEFLPQTLQEAIAPSRPIRWCTNAWERATRRIHPLQDCRMGGLSSRGQSVGNRAAIAICSERRPNSS